MENEEEEEEGIEDEGEEELWNRNRNEEDEGEESVGENLIILKDIGGPRKHTCKDQWGKTEEMRGRGRGWEDNTGCQYKIERKRKRKGKSQRYAGRQITKYSVTEIGISPSNV
jgi:hypothetical protein